MSMRGKIIAIVAGIFIIAVFVIALTVRQHHSAQPNNSGSNAFPTASSAQSSGSSAEAAMTISVQNGQSIQVKNFLSNGVTVADPANVGRYLLAGDLGYCVKESDCVAGDTHGEFNILYDQASQTFSIGLLKEPLSQSRLDAEKTLESILGIPMNELCALKYYIGTTYVVNETYSGGSLGFSGCEGAVQLPD